MSVTEAVTLISAVTAAIVAIVAAVVSAYTAIKTDSTHNLVNHQAKTLQQLAEDKGRLQGAADAQAKTNV